MRLRTLTTATAFAVAASFGAANAAPCSIGTCEVNGGPLGAQDVGIEDENVASGDYEAEGSFEVAFATNADALVDVNFDGQSGSVPSGFEDLTISFEQDSMDLGTFTITDGDGFQILNQFFLTLASTSDVFFEITGSAFNDGVTLPDYNIRLSSVPVPAALPLLISGIAGLGFASRRKKNAIRSA